MRTRFVLGPLAIAVAAFALALVVSGGTVEATEFTTNVTMTAAKAVTFNSTTNLLSWNLSWSGTQAPVNVAHFHGPAPQGVPAGVEVTIPDITSPSVGSAVITAAQANMLMSDLMYVNFHTAHSPAGEIRGQVFMAGVGGVAELPNETFAGGSNSAELIALVAGLALIVALGSAATLAYARKR
jgi:hypothetical protein